MSIQTESPKTFIATAAVTAFRRVKLTASSGTAVEHSGAGEAAIGTAQNTAAIGEEVSVRLDNAGGTHRCVAAGTVVIGAAVYNAATGYVDDASSGTSIGTALEGVSNAGDVLEVLIA
ncbi:MAG TPA: capsid cement protein [Phycisphaerae bacterium]|nr:capsid cement protein [Phycisphaerae bacterium]HUX01932.1 capsid cement protein [Phycisphaerae bacterium]